MKDRVSHPPRRPSRPAQLSPRAGTECLITGLGFWLPCGTTNFYNRASDRSGSNLHLLLSDPASQERIVSLIDSSVLNRLDAVLPTRGYFTVSRLIDTTASHPTAALYALQGQPPPFATLGHSAEIDARYTGIPNWPIEVPIHGLLYLTTSQGFTYLLAVHDTSATRDAVIHGLTQHASSLLGASFYSHFSGLSASSQPKISSGFNGSLQSYQDHNIGILNFFQINHIIEGIFNSNFDPSIFFQERRLNTKNSLYRDAFDTASRRYTLGNFCESIVVPLAVADVDLVQRVFSAETSGHSQYTDITSLRHTIDGEINRSAILRGFMDNTSSLCLRPLKLIVERCRRALLEKMLEVTHRRERIVQIESPNETTNQILLENDTQVRGFILLVAAKLPVIKNIRNHIDEQFESLKPSQDSPAASQNTGVTKAHHGWCRLLDSICDNVREIEKAITEARIDDILHEQVQLRAELETTEELARVRNRFGLTGTGSTTDGGTGSEWSNTIGTWAGVAFPLVYAIVTVMIQKKVSTLLVVIVAFAMSSVIFVSPFLISRLKNYLGSLNRLEIPTGNEFHYEFDYDLDAPMSKVDFVKLREGSLVRIKTDAIKGLRRNGAASAYSTNDSSDVLKCHMHGYREDKRSPDESVIKLHIEVTIDWHRECGVTPLRRLLERLPIVGRRDILVLSLIYEILRHVASGEPVYIVKGIRAIAIKDYALNSSELDRIRLLVARECIDVMLSEEYRIERDLVRISAGE